MTHRIFTIEAERDWVLSAGDNNFAIITREDDRLIGNCGFVTTDEVQRKAEVGIVIGEKDYLGKGYGTEAMNLLLDFGFNIRNLHSIRLLVYSYNERAIKCYEKCGFKAIGRHREAIRINGEYFDEVRMDILEDEFRALQNSNYLKQLI
jgi:RimJ/RimL family protein N-acetyltransferase